MTITALALTSILNLNRPLVRPPQHPIEISQEIPRGGGQRFVCFQRGVSEDDAQLLLEQVNQLRRNEIQAGTFWANVGVVQRESGLEGQELIVTVQQTSNTNCPGEEIRFNFLPEPQMAFKTILPNSIIDERFLTQNK